MDVPEDRSDPSAQMWTVERAHHVRRLLKDLWGDELPPAPDPELTVLIDALALDDDHGREQELVTQRDGLTIEVLHRLLRAHGPVQERLLLLPFSLQHQLVERVVYSSRPPPQQRDHQPDSRCSD
jgi:hypothetical protein